MHHDELLDRLLDDAAPLTKRQRDVAEWFRAVTRHRGAPFSGSDAAALLAGLHFAGRGTSTKKLHRLLRESLASPVDPLETVFVDRPGARTIKTEAVPFRWKAGSSAIPHVFDPVRELNRLGVTAA